MHKDTEQYTVDQQHLDDKKLGYYELAVYFASAQTQKEEFHWENFIDNLSFICDKFALHIKADGTSRLEL